MSKFDLEMTVIKSGDYKDTGSPFRKVSDADKELLQKLVGQTHEQFMQEVSAARGIPLEDVRKFSDGRIILGEQAVGLKLADEVGDVYRAAQVAIELCGLTGEPDIFYPERKEGIEKFLDQMIQSKLFSLFKTVNSMELRYQLLP